MCKRIFKDETSENGDIPFYKIGTFGDKADAFISNEKYEFYKLKFSYPNKGDILLSASGTIGRIVEYKGEKAYFQDSNIVWLNHNDKIKNSFLKVLYPTVKWDGIEGSTIKRLYNSNFLNTEIMVPDTKEQDKIGELFTNLDNLITLHQRKCDTLVNVKKSLLEKMFPKNPSNIPEIRFKEFTDVWEQRKASDLALFSKGNGYSKGDLVNEGTPIILYGRLYTKYQSMISDVDTFVVPQSGSVYSQGNEVIIPASGETAEDIARASAVEKSGILLGGDLNVLRPFNFINAFFLALSISNGKPQKELAKKAQGKSVVHIHNSDIQEVLITYPLRVEQDKICKLFTNLDNLITLHQRKLEKLKNIKKSMLERMFV